MANTLKSEVGLEKKLPGKPGDRPTFEALNYDADKLFGSSSLKVEEVAEEVEELAKGIIENPLIQTPETNPKL
jgi:hypothetical protein